MAKSAAKKDDPPKFQHWHLSVDTDGIHWLSIDRKGENTNTLGREVMAELETALEFMAIQPTRGLVISSAKASGFIAGADIREFGGANSDEVAQDIRRGHEIFNRLEKLNCPTVAAIQGFCLGGGLELSLCCDYRIAKDIPATKIGLPEVKLGIFPGLGGSVRLTERAGGLKGLELMLTGRALNARAARAAGMVDEVVGQHGELKWHARRAILQKRKAKPAHWLARLSNTAPLRPLIATIMRKQTAKKANPAHYPAPFALIDTWCKYRGDRRRMLQAEIEEVSTLMVGETATSLRRVFHLMENLKALGKQDAFTVSRVHVVGAGVMGGDIAAMCAARGMQVTLQDREMKYVEPALVRAKTTFKKVLRKPQAVQAALTRLSADVDGHGAMRADVVIEAIFEDAEAKKELLKSLEPQMKPDAVLATNTSAIPLEDLSSVLARPERLIGLHFFNPVAKMPLVEVVRSATVDAGEIDKGCSFVVQIGKFPLPVKSSPGFLVNRVLAPYMMKALSIHLEGRSKPLLDAAATDFGMPMGPVELADTVGLDVCLKVAESLGGEALQAERELIEKSVIDGNLGKKTGRGLYSWEKGKPVRSEKIDPHNPHLSALAERLLEPFLAECQACLDDGIVDSAELLDAGIIFGTGFAPFRGGPIYYLQQRDNAQAN